MTDPFWRTDPDAPFATLINVARAYCHPEADEDAYGSLIQLAHKPEPGQKMRTFKAELRAALTEPDRLQPGELLAKELSHAVQYKDGSAEGFLRRLWRELYGDEPV